MTLKQLSEKYLNEIGEKLTFEKAEEIGLKINALVYSESNKEISETDKDIIYDYIQKGIREKNISVEAFFQDSQNASNRNAAAHLLQIIKGKKR